MSDESAIFGHAQQGLARNAQQDEGRATVPPVCSASCDPQGWWNILDNLHCCYDRPSVQAEASMV